MELEDTPMDVYLHILRKCQRAFLTVYIQRMNLLDSQFYSMLEFQWQRVMPRDAVGKAPKNWSVLKYRWSPEDMMTHWLVASVDLTVGKIHLLDPFRQEVLQQIRKEQVAPLGWFLPSMLHQMGFHDARPTGEAKYEKRNRPFGVVHVLSRRGNCGAHTLRLMEYVLANRKTFDWSEEDMCTI
ncbi:hypothetical protein Dsin_022495 [Dipteronia sinensis]|uniref:Ubiquitin-like protease family profile domain-containing protein n=1 Tax=Dipteronia sinensis TaxID=43782 RepID=A0AAE0A1L3_9ROSI|nr:hypothetical protein Dsin_022495 [Dipteronia sinensis]